MAKKTADGELKSRYFVCKPCQDKGKLQVPRTCYSTTPVAYHLEGDHGVIAEGKLPKVVGSIERHLVVQPLAQGREAERWQQALINCVAHCDLTFRQVSSSYFRTLLTHSGPHISRLLPTENSVRSWLKKAFEQRKPDVIKSLEGARSKINLSFDLWSSGNDNLLLRTVGHWIDTHTKVRRALLGLRQ